MHRFRTVRAMCVHACATDVCCPCYILFYGAHACTHRLMDDGVIRPCMLERLPLLVWTRAPRSHHAHHVRAHVYTGAITCDSCAQARE
jgi:hypothetical protein